MIRIRILSIAVLVLFVVGSTSRAISRAPADSSVVRVKFFDLRGGLGRVFIVVRKDGDLASHRYVVEARPTCGGVTNNWRGLPVVPIAFACHIDPSSIHFDLASSTVLFEVFRAQSGSDCKKESEGIRFPVNHLCDLE